MPTDDDVIRARLRTLGVQEYRFIFDHGMSNQPNFIPHLLKVYLKAELLAKSGGYTTLVGPEVVWVFFSMVTIK